MKALPEAATAVLLALLVAVPARGADRFVSTTGSDAANDCASSAAPCSTLGQALTQAASGETVKVAAGLYSESVFINVPITLTFSGGWTQDFASRDPAVNVTTVTSDQSDTFAIEGTQGQTLDVTLDGFSIVGGAHRASFGVEHTGGIDAQAFFDSTVTLTIVGSTFIGNSSSVGGALELTALNAGTLHASLTDCTIMKTFGPQEAIAVFSRDAAAASLDLTGCTVAKNATGGIYAFAGETSTLALALTGSDVTHNKGAGIAVFSSENAGVDATVTDSVVELNKGTGFGGGINIGCPTIDGTGHLGLSLAGATLTRNQARFDGGGLFVSSGSDASCAVGITNSVISRNKALHVGGGVAAAATGFGTGTLTLGITNSTITRNRSSAGGGGVNVATDPQSNAHSLTATLTNAILFNNRAPRSAVTGGMDLRLDQVVGTVTVDADHDDIGDLLVRAGTFNDLGGNISAKPLFVNANNVHLTGASPCIDVGTCIGAPTVDIDGDPRPTGAGCDIGADEFVP